MGFPFHYWMFIVIVVLSWNANGSTGHERPEPRSTTHPSFKVLTQIFEPGTKTPISINQTLFSENMVYDLRLNPRNKSVVEISIFDSDKRNFVLLDCRREQKLELNRLQMARIFEGMKSEIESNTKTKTIFLEQVTEDIKRDPTVVLVGNKFVTYRGKGERIEDEAVFKHYFSFLDAFTMMAATRTQAMPPFVRMHLNRTMKKAGIFPAEISLRIAPNEIWNDEFRANSRHSLVLELDQQDQQRIQDAKRMSARFDSVDLQAYRQIEVAETDIKPVK